MPKKRVMPIVGMIFASLIILLVQVSANFFVARNVYLWLGLFLPRINPLVYFGAYLFLVVIVILGFARSALPIPSVIKNILGWISSYLIGIFIYLLMLFFIADLVLFLGSITKIIPQPWPTSVQFIKGLVVLVMTAGIIGYGAHNARQIKHVSYDVQLSGHTVASEMKIALISDLHLGATNNEKNLEKIVRGINNTKPDVVCIAGDIFSDDLQAMQNPAKVSNLLKGIQAKYGVYASFGNHDRAAFDEMVRFLEESNIKLLSEEHVVIDDRLVLIGRADPSPVGRYVNSRRKDTAEVLALEESDLPVAVMEHNPSVINQYGEGTDLILSGHTHRGQIIPGNLIARAIFPVNYGHYQKAADSPHVIVTSGVGTWGTPLRIGSNNEVASIILR